MTNGVIVILKDGEVIAKVIVGCNGHRERERRLARIIYCEGLRDAEDINSAAEALRYGCPDCRVVMTEDCCVYPYNDEPLDSYKDTFQQIGVNPRYQTGDRRWNPTVLDLDNYVIYEWDERWKRKEKVHALST